MRPKAMSGPRSRFCREQKSDSDLTPQGRSRSCTYLHCSSTRSTGIAQHSSFARLDEKLRDYCGGPTTFQRRVNRSRRIQTAGETEKLMQRVFKSRLKPASLLQSFVDCKLSENYGGQSKVLREELVSRIGARAGGHKLNLASYGLRNQSFKALLKILRNRPDFVQINLSQNNFNVEGALDVIEEVAGDRELVDLRLSGCSLQGDLLCHLLTSLHHHPTLYHLDLSSDNNLTRSIFCPRAIQLLANFVQSCPNLQILNLTGSTLSSFAPLRRGLAGRSIEQLNLTGVKLAGLAKALDDKTLLPIRMNKLVVTRCSLRNKEFQALVGAMGRDQLLISCLQACKNEVEDAGIFSLCMLQSDRAIDELDLGGNSFEKFKAWSEFSYFLNKCKLKSLWLRESRLSAWNLCNLRSSFLQSLNLRGNRLMSGIDKTTVLTTLLENLPGLQRLDLSRCGVSIQTIRYTNRGAVCSKKLKHLALNENDLYNDAGPQLLAFVRKYNSLSSMPLAHNFIEPSILDQIAEVAANCKRSQNDIKAEIAVEKTFTKERDQIAQGRIKRYREERESLQAQVEAWQIGRIAEASERGLGTSRGGRARRAVGECAGLADQQGEVADCQRKEGPSFKMIVITQRISYSFYRSAITSRLRLRWLRFSASSATSRSLFRSRQRVSFCWWATSLKKGLWAESSFAFSFCLARLQAQSLILSTLLSSSFLGPEFAFWLLDLRFCRWASSPRREQRRASAALSRQVMMPSELQSPLAIHSMKSRRFLLLNSPKSLRPGCDSTRSRKKRNLSRKWTLLLASEALSCTLSPLLFNDIDLDFITRVSRPLSSPANAPRVASALPDPPAPPAPSAGSGSASPPAQTPAAASSPPPAKSLPTRSSCMLRRCPRGPSGGAREGQAAIPACLWAFWRTWAWPPLL